MVFSLQGVRGFSFFWRCHLKLSGGACGVPGEVARGVVYALASSLRISASVLPSLVTALLCVASKATVGYISKRLEPSSCPKRWSAWAFVVVRESLEPHSFPWRRAGLTSFPVPSLAFQASVGCPPSFCRYEALGLCLSVYALKWKLRLRV
ncbi:unnamed protein product [Brassica rapa subsp. narinosa]